MCVFSKKSKSCIVRCDFKCFLILDDVICIVRCDFKCLWSLASGGYRLCQEGRHSWPDHESVVIVVISCVFFSKKSESCIVRCDFKCFFILNDVIFIVRCDFKCLWSLASGGV